MLSVEPLYAIACINVHAHVKKQPPNTGSHIPLSGHTTKYCMHTLTGMGSATLAAAPPGKSTQISRKDNEVLKPNMLDRVNVLFREQTATTSRHQSFYVETNSQLWVVS